MRDLLVGKSLVLVGAVILVLGLVWMAAERFGLGRLPADIVVERKGVTFSFPIVTCLIVSVVLSLVFRFLNRS